MNRTVEQQIFDNKIKKLSEIIWEMLRHYNYTDHIEQPNLNSRKCFCRNCIIEKIKNLNANGENYVS